MTSSLLVASAGQGVVFSPNTTRYMACGMTALDAQTTQVDRQIIFREPGGINTISVRVSAHFRTVGDITLQKNGSDTALTVNVPSSTAGYFEFNDFGNDVVVADGDMFNYKDVQQTSVGGSMTVTAVSIVFTPTDSTKTVVRCVAVSINNYWGFGSNMMPLCGYQGSQFLVEERAQCGFSSDAVLMNLDAYLPVNSRGGCDFFTRINGVSGTVQSDMGTIGTGYFNDLFATTGHSDAITYGDLVNMMWVGGNTGGGSNEIYPKWCAIDLVTYDKTFYFLFSQPASITLFTDPDYFPVGGTGIAGQATESGAQLDFNLAGRRIADFWTQVAVGAAGSNDTQLMFRKNAANTNVYIDVPATEDGQFRSRFNESLAANDDICIRGSGGFSGVYSWTLRVYDDTATKKFLGNTTLLGNTAIL